MHKTTSMRSSFNGAATFRSRKAHSARCRLRLHACFNGAATFRSRKVNLGHVEGIQQAELQWGRDLSVAEGSLRASGPDHALHASMGPRPFGRGRRDVAALCRRRYQASMGPRPFGRGRDHICRGQRRQVARFNGAATFRSRKAVPGDIPAAPDLSLQWGRDLSVAEGAYAFAAAAWIAMLQWGRDLSVAEGCSSWDRATGKESFNGAATFRSRKECDLFVVLSDISSASMGPRPFGRGRPANGPCTAQLVGASMGPRPFGRGRVSLGHL